MGEISLALRRLGGENAVQENVGVDYTPTTDVGVSKTLQRLNNMVAANNSVGDYSNDVQQGGITQPGMTNVRIYSGGESRRVTVPLQR